VEDARQIWDRLISKPWARGDANLDQVMAELADFHSIEHLIVSDDWRAKTPYKPPLSPIPPGDRYLIEELSRRARAPYEAMSWPEPPDIDLGRLGADFERTTGRHLELAWQREQLPEIGFWHVEVSIDGAVSGGVGRELSGDSEVDLVRLTDRLQSEHLGEELEGGWPKCPHHRNIVMVPRTNPQGLACWTCQADPAHHVAIGRLGLDRF
jgi:hypothetical protein